MNGIDFLARLLLSFTLQSLIYLEFIFMNNVGWKLAFIFLKLESQLRLYRMFSNPPFINEMKLLNIFIIHVKFLFFYF